MEKLIILNKYPGEMARDYASRCLIKNILALTFKPGALLSENELAKELGISRTPLREALLELNRSGVVETLPQKGNFVSLIDTDLIEEARFVREVLDLAVVEIACRIATEQDLMDMEANVKMQEFYLEKDMPDKVMELDDEFHRMIYKAANKERTYGMKTSMMVHFDRARALCMATVKDNKVVKDHRRIFEAIREKDVGQALMLTKKHLARYEVDKEEIARKYPQFFKEKN